MEKKNNLLIYTFVFIICLFLGWLLLSSLQKKRTNEQRLELVAPILESSGVEVAVLGTEWCSYCEKTREYLELNRVPFRWIDIEKNVENRVIYDSFGAAGVPLIVTKEFIIEGYKINELKKIHY